MDKKSFTFAVCWDLAPCSLTDGVPKFQENHLQSFTGKKRHILYPEDGGSRSYRNTWICFKKQQIYFNRPHSSPITATLSSTFDNDIFSVFAPPLWHEGSQRNQNSKILNSNYYRFGGLQQTFAEILVFDSSCLSVRPSVCIYKSEKRGTDLKIFKI
jgi:hypothetical protein